MRPEDRALAGRHPSILRCMTAYSRPATVRQPSVRVASVDDASRGCACLPVWRVALGCGGFGGIGSAPRFFGAGEPEDEARALMDAAWEMGITLFDTADAYGGGRSETMIGRWLRDRGPEVRSRIVLTTKVFHSVV